MLTNVNIFVFEKMFEFIFQYLDVKEKFLLDHGQLGLDCLQALLTLRHTLAYSTQARIKVGASLNFQKKASMFFCFTRVYITFNACSRSSQGKFYFASTH